MLKRSTADLKMNLLLVLARSDGLPRVGIEITEASRRLQILIYINILFISFMIHNKYH